MNGRPGHAALETPPSRGVGLPSSVATGGPAQSARGPRTDAGREVDSPQAALITGASSGIGAAYAHRLAAQGCDVILVARRKPELASLAAGLEQRFRTGTEVVVADLATPEGVAAVTRRVATAPPHWLVNSAGFGIPGRFDQVPLDRLLAMIRLHVLAAVELCHAVLPGMIARGRGRIVNVASIGALLPRAGDATYCATKAYLLMFSHILHAELAGSGVQVQALCPGFTHSGFYRHREYAGYPIEAAVPGPLWMSAESVAAASIRAFARDRPVCVPGLPNRLFMTLARVGLGGRLAGRLTDRLEASAASSTAMNSR